MSVRLWTPYTPEPFAQWMPAGAVVEVSAAEATQICQAGGGEIIGPPVETATIETRERAVRIKAKRKKARAR